MLNKKDADAILAGFEKNMAEEMPLINYHQHTPENPFGLHRHKMEDPLDGPHTHTPQNPGGEHAHGELKGQALIDGAHIHRNVEYDGGWHSHESHKPQTIIPISQPSIELPKSPTQPKPE